MKTRYLITLLLLLAMGMQAQLTVFQDDFEDGFPGSWTQEQVKGEYSWALQTGAACVYPTGAVSGESRVWFYAPANDPATTRLVIWSIKWKSSKKLNAATAQITTLMPMLKALLLPK